MGERSCVRYDAAVLTGSRRSSVERSSASFSSDAEASARGASHGSRITVSGFTRWRGGTGVDTEGRTGSYGCGSLRDSLRGASRRRDVAEMGAGAGLTGAALARRRAAGARSARRTAEAGRRPVARDAVRVMSRRVPSIANAPIGSSRRFKRTMAEAHETPRYQGSATTMTTAPADARVVVGVGVGPGYYGPAYGPAPYPYYGCGYYCGYPGYYGPSVAFGVGGWGGWRGGWRGGWHGGRR